MDGPKRNMPPEEKRFAKGVSGNPGGRSKATARVEALAREFTEEAIQGLAQIARDPKGPAAARVAAWNSLLDRGHGKARQVVDLGTDTSDLPDDALRTRIAARIAELLDVGPGTAGADGGGEEAFGPEEPDGILH